MPVTFAARPGALVPLDSSSRRAMREPNVAASFALDAGAALLTSAGYNTFFYPLHRIKTLLQTQESHADIISGKITRYKFHTSFSRIISEQGFTALWRGNFAYMLRHVPSTTLSFAFKDTLLQHILPKYDPVTEAPQYVGTHLAAGGLAGVLALALVYPLDFATIRMAASLGHADPSLIQTLMHTAKTGGIGTLYRGFPVAATAIGAYKALYFGLYDVAKTYFHVTGPGDLKARRRRKGSADQGPPEVTPHSKFTLTPLDLSIGGDPKSSAWPSDDELDGHEEHSGPHRLSSMGHEMSSGIKTFLNGSVLKGLDPVLQNRLGNIFWSWVIASGVVYVASTITYPLDVVRKRLVVDTASSVRQFSGVWDCVAKIAQKEGIAGFYRFYGFDMLLRFGGGLLLVLYDEVKASTRGAAKQVHILPLLSELIKPPSATHGGKQDGNQGNSSNSKGSTA